MKTPKDKSNKMKNDSKKPSKRKPSNKEKSVSVNSELPLILNENIQSNTPPSKTKYIELNINDVMQKMMQQESIKEFIHKEAIKRLDTEEEIKNLTAILTEFFSTFIVLGYGVDGNRIVIKHTKTDRDEDSIVEVLRYVFMRIINGE